MKKAKNGSESKKKRRMAKLQWRKVVSPTRTWKRLRIKHPRARRQGLLEKRTMKRIRNNVALSPRNQRTF